MSVAPTSHTGKVLLQPSYFTSSCYVDTLRSDIDALVKTFEGEYAESEEKNKPFTLFKAVWCAMGWQWMHFKVFDARCRDTFVQVTSRLLIGKLCHLFLRDTITDDALRVRAVWRAVAHVPTRSLVCILHFLEHSTLWCSCLAYHSTHPNPTRYVVPAVGVVALY